jgi:hypothetical protein
MGEGDRRFRERALAPVAPVYVSIRVASTVLMGYVTTSQSVTVTQVT